MLAIIYNYVFNLLTAILTLFEAIFNHECNSYIDFLQEQDIPIDINTGKLLEWLVNRRHCQKDWQTHVLKIREKINNAIQDMPAHDGIAKLLSGSRMFYFLPLLHIASYFCYY